MHTGGQTGRHVAAPGILAVRADDRGIVLAQASILADSRRVNRHVAEDHDQPAAGGPQLVAERGEVPDKLVHLP